jgi:hypothetical protein
MRTSSKHHAITSSLLSPIGGRYTGGPLYCLEFIKVQVTRFKLQGKAAAPCIPPDPHHAATLQQAQANLES